MPTRFRPRSIAVRTLGALLLVVWVAALTLMRGITEIVVAFRLRKLKETVRATPAAV